MVGMTRPLTPAQLGPRLAEVYHLLGPLYRAAQRWVEGDEPTMGMSMGVRAVLDELNWSSPATVPALARRLDVSRQFVQRMVNDALAAGWVERHPNPEHQRSSLLDLTSAGQQAIDAVIRREHERLGRTPGGLSDQDIDATLRVLDAMRKGIDLPEVTD